MTLGVFWARYDLVLHAKRLREIDAKYTFLIEYQKWNWLVSKVPEKAQIQLLRGHNHGDDCWTCQDWRQHMIDWIKENKPQEVYEAVLDKIQIIHDTPNESFESAVARLLSQEELNDFQQAGYFKSIPKKGESKESQ